MSMMTRNTHVTLNERTTMDDLLWFGRRPGNYTVRLRRTDGEPLLIKGVVMITDPEWMPDNSFTPACLSVLLNRHGGGFTIVKRYEGRQWHIDGSFMTRSTG